MWVKLVRWQLLKPRCSSEVLCPWSYCDVSRGHCLGWTSGMERWWTQPHRLTCLSRLSSAAASIICYRLGFITQSLPLTRRGRYETVTSASRRRLTGNKLIIQESLLICQSLSDEHESAAEALFEKTKRTVQAGEHYLLFFFFNYNQKSLLGPHSQFGWRLHEMIKSPFVIGDKREGPLADIYSDRLTVSSSWFQSNFKTHTLLLW